MADRWLFSELRRPPPRRRPPPPRTITAEAWVAACCTAPTHTYIMGHDALALRCACGTVPHFFPCLCAPWVSVHGLPCECGATNFRIHACPTCHTTIGLAGAAELVARAWLHAVIPGWPRPGTGGRHG